jgi:tetratricopeptide (TPR) repeat protein
VATGPDITPEPLDGAAGAHAWLTAQHGTLLDALHGALHDGLDQQVQALAAVLQPYLERTENWSDLAATAGAALTAARRRGDRPAEAVAHQQGALADLNRHRYDEALRHLLAALDLQAGGESAAESTARGYTHRAIAMVLTEQGRLPAALGHNQRALELYRAAGNRRGEGVALNELGWHHGLLGQYETGLAACTEAERLLGELPDPIGRSAALDSLGYLYRHLGDPTRAVRCYQLAADLRAASAQPYHQAQTLLRLGDTHAAAGDTAAARQVWQQALSLLTDLGHPDTHALLDRLGHADLRVVG